MNRGAPRWFGHVGSHSSNARGQRASLLSVGRSSDHRSREDAEKTVIGESVALPRIVPEHDVGLQPLINQAMRLVRDVACRRRSAGRQVGVVAGDRQAASHCSSSRRTSGGVGARVPRTFDPSVEEVVHAVRRRPTYEAAPHLNPTSLDEHRSEGTMARRFDRDGGDGVVAAGPPGR
jgi:hypothetical protein